MRLYKSLLLEATIDIDFRRIYFWGGIFSQWAKCDIHDTGTGITFNCAEQAMMWNKARLFDDSIKCARILAEPDPRNQKALGRAVENYDDAVWAEKRFGIVERINYLKFSQYPAWTDLLVLTEGYEIVEASPYDTVWGVGLGENDPLILDRTNWRGMNLLGEAIMSARKRIIGEKARQ